MGFDSSKSNALATWPRPLALVFSGGGAYGATQVGMLRALAESGVVPDMVVGSSVGALNATLFAADPRRAPHDLAKIWSSMHRSGVFGGRTRIGTAFSALRHGLSRNPGLCSPEPLRTLIDTNLEAERLEDLGIPTAVVVTDALVGQPKLLTQGLIRPALQATAAIPGVFPPVKIEGCIYIDGGVTANVPIRQAVAFGAKSLVVLDANPASMPGTLPDSTLGSVLHASMIMLRNQRADATEGMAGKHPILHLPQVTPTTQSSFDFSNSAELVSLGYDHTREFLDQLPSLTDASRGHGQSAAGEGSTRSTRPDQGDGDRQAAAHPPPLSAEERAASELTI